MAITSRFAEILGHFRSYFFYLFFNINHRLLQLFLCYWTYIILIHLNTSFSPVTTVDVIVALSRSTILQNHSRFNQLEPLWLSSVLICVSLCFFFFFFVQSHCHCSIHSVITKLPGTLLMHRYRVDTQVGRKLHSLSYPGNNFTITLHYYSEGRARAHACGTLDRRGVSRWWPPRNLRTRNHTKFSFLQLRHPRISRWTFKVP